MVEKQNKPRIRFRGFEEEWKEKTVIDVCSISTGKSNTQDKVEDGKYPFYVRSPIIERSNRYLYDEEAVLTVGDGVGTGKVYHYVNGKYDLHQRVYRMYEFDEVIGKYFFYYFANNFNSRVMAMTAKTSVDSVRLEMISEMLIKYPEPGEQSKIASFFQSIDRLLTLHQQQYQKLINLKKSMLEKMFPKAGADVPEIRFNGFIGAWIRKKFEKTFTNVPNNSLSRAQLNYQTGLAKNIHYGDVLIKFSELLDIKKHRVPFISSNGLVDKLKSSKLQTGDIVIADAAEDQSVGKCTELINLGEEMVFSGLHTIPVRPIQSFASGYLGYFMNSPSYHNQLLSLMQGTKVLSISKSAIKNTSIIYPVDNKEQEKISVYLQNLDNLITQHQIQLTKLKNIKKACLEKMFV